MQKTCVICKEIFDTNYPRKLTCSDDCGKIYHNLKAREYHSKKKPTKSKKKKKMTTNNNMEKIADKAVQARKLGMTYGMLVAMEQMEKEKRVTGI